MGRKMRLRPSGSGRPPDTLHSGRRLIPSGIGIGAEPQSWSEATCTAGGSGREGETPVALLPEGALSTGIIERSDMHSSHREREGWLQWFLPLEGALSPGIIERSDEGEVSAGFCR